MTQKQPVKPDEAPKAIEPTRNEPPKRIQTDGNTRTLPIFPLQKRRSRSYSKKGRHLIKLEGNRPLDDGSLQHYLWQVEGPLQPADKATHMTVEAHITANYIAKGKEVPRYVKFDSIRQFYRYQRNNTPSGWNIKDLKASFKRIKATVITTENTWIYPESKEEQAGKFVDGIFGLYDEVWFHGDLTPTGEKLTRGIAITLSDTYRESINNNATMPLDYWFWLELEKPTSRRMMELFAAKFYGLIQGGGKVLTQDYNRFCQAMPIEPQKYKSAAKRMLAKQFDVMVERGFFEALPTWQWEDHAKRFFVRPGKKASSDSSDPVERPGQETDPLVTELMKRGFNSASQAKKLVNETPDVVLQQIAYFDYEVDAGKPMQDKGAVLADRIKYNRSKPVGYLSPEERKRREAQANREHQAREKADTERRDRKARWWKYETPEHHAQKYVNGRWTMRWASQHGSTQPTQVDKNDAYQQALDDARKEKQGALQQRDSLSENPARLLASPKTQQSNGTDSQNPTPPASQ